MEVGIRNFTEAGNNLMWRKGWRDYQHEKCLSKGRVKMENKVHYDRILNSLTDNRSIDVLVEPSMENVKKMPEREFIIKYVNESKGKMTPQNIAVAIAIALDVPVTDSAKIRSIFNSVMDQLKSVVPPQNAQISIAVDDRPIEIIATPSGVRASENPISMTGVSSVSIDEESGERGVQIWEGDNQAPIRGINPTDAGFRMTEVPAQFSVPTGLPPNIMDVMYNRQGLPNTNSLTLTEITDMGTQTLNPEYYTTEQEYRDEPFLKRLRYKREGEKKVMFQGKGDYGEGERMDEATILERSVAKSIYTVEALPKRNKITQTALTGDEGMMTTESQRKEFPRGGYSSGPPSRASSGFRASIGSIMGETSRTASGAIIFSPTGPFSLVPSSGESSGTMTPYP